MLTFKNESVHKCGRERDQDKTIQTVTFGQPLNQVQFVILLFRLTSGSYLQTINVTEKINFVTAIILVFGGIIMK